jgi:cytochrome bd-type quinol oxidase subunit 1
LPARDHSLGVAAIVGIVEGPGPVRVAVGLGLLSAALFFFAITFMVMVPTDINQNAALLGTVVAMLAVLAGWRATSRDRTN